jgi:hypothetical protein
MSSADNVYAATSSSGAASSSSSSSAAAAAAAADPGGGGASSSGGGASAVTSFATIYPSNMTSVSGTGTTTAAFTAGDQGGTDSPPQDLLEVAANAGASADATADATSDTEETESTANATSDAADSGKKAAFKKLDCCAAPKGVRIELGCGHSPCRSCVTKVGYVPGGCAQCHRLPRLGQFDPKIVEAWHLQLYELLGKKPGKRTAQASETPTPKPERKRARRAPLAQLA